MTIFKLIDIQSTDFAWLQALCDLEELDAPLELLKLQMKCRPHLKMEKRAFGLEHLKQVN
jgi:hypothetical protein